MIAHHHDHEEEQKDEILPVHKELSMLDVNDAL
jgi:hypothetical protein